MNSFFTKEELYELGLKKVGNNVLISKFARIYNPEKLSVGNNVRIDDFCIITGEIILHDYIHISAGCFLYGKYGIEIKSYSGTSPRVVIFSAIDDFSGEYLINSMVSEKFTNVNGGKVLLEKYVQVGAGSIVFPAITIGEGTVSGAMSLIKKNLDSWKIVAGIPARVIKNRKKDLLRFI